MRKLIAAINMTLDGYCDHTAGVPDEALHQHYADLLNSADVILYGRITYQLMEYWKTVLDHPTGEEATDSFAVAIDHIPKIVFSRTLREVDWDTATIAKRDPKAEVAALKQQSGRDILVGSPGLIASLTALGLVDEYQLCIHPVIAGKGLPLFRGINDTITLHLTDTRTFGSGAVIHYYRPAKNLQGV